MTFKNRIILTLAAMTGLLTAGCAGTSSVTSAADRSEQFSNVLVIAITGDYNVRSQFERVVVSNIRKKGAAASTWYSVIGGNKPLTKQDVNAAIDEQGFDSVLAIRSLDGNIEMKLKNSRT